MASEPNNASANAETEKRLKQYAAERRQSVPASMHQATRNILQGEIRRTYGASDRDRRSRIRLRWFQALAWLIIFAAVPLFLIPHHPDLARPAHSVPSTPNEVNLPTANAPGASPLVLSDTKEPVHPVGEVSQDSVKQTLATAAAVAPAPAPAASPAESKEKDSAAMRGVPTSAPQRETEVRLRTREELKPMPVSRAAVPRRDLAVPESLKKAETKSEFPKIETTANTLNFANTVPNQMILNNFKIEQTGARLKIVDQDGSVYAGGVLTQQAGNDVFNVAGYSRTLNKATVITGQVVRANLANLGRQQQAQQTQPQPAIGGAAASNLQAAQSSRVPLLSNNSAKTGNTAISNNSAYINNADEVRIQGNAIVGNKQYKLDAQAAPGQ
jgi:hypothetical protein